MIHKLRDTRSKVLLAISAVGIVGFVVWFLSVLLTSTTDAGVELAIDESLRFASSNKLLGFSESDGVMRIRSGAGIDCGKRFLLDNTPDNLRALVMPSFCISIEETSGEGPIVDKEQHGIFEVCTRLNRGVENVRFRVVLRRSEGCLEVLEVLAYPRGG